MMNYLIISKQFQNLKDAMNCTIRVIDSIYHTSQEIIEMLQLYRDNVRNKSDIEVIKNLADLYPDNEFEERDDSICLTFSVPCANGCNNEKSIIKTVLQKDGITICNLRIASITEIFPELTELEIRRAEEFAVASS